MKKRILNPLWHHAFLRRAVKLNMATKDASTECTILDLNHSTEFLIAIDKDFMDGKLNAFIEIDKFYDDENTESS